MESKGIEKSVTHQLIDTVEYVSGSVVIKSVLKKRTGMVTVSSFDYGEGLFTKSSPFDKLVQILEGEAEIIIDDISIIVRAGQSIIIPAHVKNSIKAHTRFKMVSTVVKSGYEDVSL